jgi:hypothetical protein
MNSAIRKNGKGGSDLGESELCLVLVFAGQVTRFILKLNATKGLKNLITRISFCFLSVV